MTSAVTFGPADKDSVLKPVDSFLLSSLFFCDRLFFGHLQALLRSSPGSPPGSSSGPSSASSPLQSAPSDLDSPISTSCWSILSNSSMSRSFSMMRVSTERPCRPVASSKSSVILAVIVCVVGVCAMRRVGGGLCGGGLRSLVLAVVVASALLWLLAGRPRFMPWSSSSRISPFPPLLTIISVVIYFHLLCRVLAVAVVHARVPDVGERWRSSSRSSRVSAHVLLPRSEAIMVDCR